LLIQLTLQQGAAQDLGQAGGLASQEPCCPNKTWRQNFAPESSYRSSSAAVRRCRAAGTRADRALCRAPGAPGAELAGISNHALLHTAGTLGYLRTGDLRAVQEVLRYADPRRRARYAQVVDMAKRNPVVFIFPGKAE